MSVDVVEDAVDDIEVDDDIGEESLAEEPSIFFEIESDVLDLVGIVLCDTDSAPITA